MAEKAHISLKAWQKMENGRTRLDLERLDQIARLLETSLLDIVWNVTSEHKKQEFMLNYVGNSKLPEEERQLYERLIAVKDEQIDYYRDILKNEIINIIKSTEPLDL